MALPTTPTKRTGEIRDIIESLNGQFCLQLPSNTLSSPLTRPKSDSQDRGQECVRKIRFLFFKQRDALERAIANFGEMAPIIPLEWAWKRKQDSGTLPTYSSGHLDFANPLIPRVEGKEKYREKLIVEFLKNLNDEVQLIQQKDPLEPQPNTSPGRSNLFKLDGRTIPEMQGGIQAERWKSSETTPTRPIEPDLRSERRKRKSIESEELYFSAPTSPSHTFKRNSIIGRSISDNPLLQSPNGIAANYNGVDFDANHEEAQNSKIARPSKKQHPPISNFFQKLQDAANSRPEPLPTPLVSAPQSNSPFNTESKHTLSFTSIISNPSLQSSIPSHDTSARTSFRSELTSKPEFSTQDTNISLLVDLARSFDSPAINGQDAIESSSSKEQYDIIEARNHPVYRDLVENGPFHKSASIDPVPPLRCHYELARIASAWNTSIQELQVGVIPEEHDKFWDWAKVHVKREQKNFPEKSPKKAWDSAIDRFCGEDSFRSVQLSGKLRWAEAKGPGVFEVRLAPFQLDTSCRLYRKFGADRFLVLSLPQLEKHHVPKHLNASGTLKIRQVISEWLTNEDHHFLGRTWKAFYVETEKKAKVKKTGRDSDKKPQVNTIFRFKVHFFAVEGVGIEKMTIAQLLSWHIPLGFNNKSTECKSFQRLALGLSKTTPTVVLHPSEFTHLHDKDPVMNDGCARMSRSLARAVSEKLELSHVPSAFQARIAGAKGMWMVVDDHELEESEAKSDRGFLIEVSDSQLKIHPHPALFFPEEDEEKVTFEVVTWVKPLRPAHLNAQLIAILQDRKVSRSRLEELQRVDLRSIYGPLIASKNDRLLCRQWLQTYAATSGERGGSVNYGIRTQGALPASSVEIPALLLESGFEPGKCQFLAESIKSILLGHLDRHIERLQIQVPLSTYAFCLADPYGCLAPDEVHFGFSKNWEWDPDKRFTDNLLDGMDILVGRLPALLPSDIQKRKAVWKKELRHFKDVVVFPTTGDHPLADLLSGGDYDGDNPWVCWDPMIVSTFVNAERPPLPGPEHFGVVKNTKAMIKSPDEIPGFLSRCFDFNLHPTLLEVVSLEHETVRYYDSSGVSCSAAIQLAVLAGLLVDAAKQGYHLSEEAWRLFRKTVSPWHKGPPAYKDVDRGMSRWKKNDTLDFLKFCVAIPEKEKLLTAFQREWLEPSTMTKDPQLSCLWQTYWKQAEQEDKLNKSELLHVLEDLKSKVSEVRNNWSQRAKRSTASDGSFAEHAQAVQDELQAIVPLNKDHELVDRFNTDKKLGIGQHASLWNRLRASCAYDTNPGNSKFSWYAAGDVLCTLKVESSGIPFRMITEDIYVALKVDSKLVRRIRERDFDEYENKWDEDSEVEDLMAELAMTM